MAVIVRKLPFILSFFQKSKKNSLMETEAILLLRDPLLWKGGSKIVIGPDSAGRAGQFAREMLCVCRSHLGKGIDHLRHVIHAAPPDGPTRQLSIAGYFAAKVLHVVVHGEEASKTCPSDGVDVFTCPYYGEESLPDGYTIHDGVLDHVELGDLAYCFHWKAIWHFDGSQRAHSNGPRHFDIVSHFDLPLPRVAINPLLEEVCLTREALQCAITTCFEVPRCYRYLTRHSITYGPSPFKRFASRYTVREPHRYLVTVRLSCQGRNLPQELHELIAEHCASSPPSQTHSFGSRVEMKRVFSQNTIIPSVWIDRIETYRKRGYRLSLSKDIKFNTGLFLSYRPAFRPVVVQTTPAA